MSNNTLVDSHGSFNLDFIWSYFNFVYKVLW